MSVAWGRWTVSCANEIERASLGVGEHTLAVHGDAVGCGEKAEAACFFSGCRNFRGGDGLEGLLQGFHHFDGFAASAGANCFGSVDGAQQHLFAATAAGSSPTPTSTSPV